MFKWLTNVIGDSNEKVLRRQQPTVARINSLEPEFQRLSPEELHGKTQEFKERLADGESLDELLPEAFAAVRESARRNIGQRHFDVQLLGGIVLHQGRISEMKTGEGKTLVATLALYLNSLTGQGCHLVTVNDYLAKRDPHWMGPIFHALGASVASIQHEAAFLYDPTFDSGDERWRYLRPISRREAYEADITYGTNNEFGFDYLRDNMVMDLSQCVQRPLNYAIVDEVDNILIDEARTPLIISGQAEESADKYFTFARLVPRLREGEDYVVDEKTRAATLTEAAIGKMEKWLNLPNIYDPEHYAVTQYLENALKAQVIFKRDRDYVVKDGQVIIVDEFTGRLMFGRRYSEGLHQAIEAKEGVKIQRESITLATITFQNYFRLYKKLAGMTGTAATEAEEFFKIYKLEVVVVPTNKPMIRHDLPDQIYKNEKAKFDAVVREIEALHEKGQPILVGTVSIEKSEHLSDLLIRRGVPHQVLNAKFHEKEAGIVAQAGKLGGVTIATNMAGRGTDILLGGNRSPEVSDEEWGEEHEKVVELGGLHIVGTERHEARRIDNQLRGRSGRQGDPGSSRFYISLEDDIMRRFGGDRVKSFMEWAGMEDDVPIEHSLVSKAIENSQTRVEGYNFDIRKHVVEYDDVMNKHREVIYAERKKILSGTDLRANILDMIHQELQGVVASFLQDEHGDNWDLDTLVTTVNGILPLPPDLHQDGLSKMSRRELEERLLDLSTELYEAKEQELGAENMRALERLVMLRAIDTRWIEHLTTMENMREGIGLYAYGQADPLVAYKREAHAMYGVLQSNIQHDIVHAIYHLTIVREAPSKPATPMAQARATSGQREPARVGGKIGRNDPCPCGSGKKYKKCHGR
ncbi:MAG: preprotein translocase subunit SecA [Chloroflexi bacterium]|nr:preprotein translocase subunit SecA [Chloroflexota bacterium]